MSLYGNSISKAESSREGTRAALLQTIRSANGPGRVNILLDRATLAKTPVSARADCQNRENPFLGCPRAILGLPMDANSGVHGAPHAAIAASNPFTPTIAITRLML